MRIQLKLMGLLKDRTPPGGELEVVAGSTIAQILAGLGVPDQGVQALSVNGSIERDRQRVLVDGDEVTVIPPVGGG
jgi:sulfur carrier protein ThiS